jgi:hypothetical protein
MPSPPTARQAIGLGLRLAVAALALTLQPGVCGQDASSPATTADRGEPSASTVAGEVSAKGPTVIEQPPRTIFAPDAQGNLVPLINIPLSTIQRLLNQRDGAPLAQQPPTFQFNRLMIRGVTREGFEGFAELDVDLDLTVLTSVEGEGPSWTALPLRFHDASLLSPPAYVGDGQFHLSFDLDAGYQGWLSHERPGEHHLSLKLAVPMVEAAGSSQLRFFPPLANQSQLDFQVPGTGIAAEIENARNLTVETPEVGPTSLHAQDLRNQVVVTWRHGTASGDQPPTYLDVRGDIRVTIDGPGAIRSNATLDLQSYGRPIEQFNLRLPPHTKIVSGNPPGYAISELTGSADDSSGERTTVQIKLEKPAPTARVQLATQTTENGESSGAANVANFEVLGAIRQSGRVSLLTSEEWRVYWTLGPSVRRVQNVEAFEATQERKQLASFQYFRQPCRLDVQIEPQGSRVGVEPNYRLRVSEDRLALEAQLNYKLQGARVSFLNIALNGWQLDDVGPNGAVENDAFADAGSEPIPMRLTKATSGDLSLTLDLHRPIERRRGTLRLPLPWPSADAITPGTLVVTSGDSVVMNFRLQEMTGLVQDPLLATTLAAPHSSESRPATATAFRFMADRPVSEIVLDYEVRQQEQRVRMDSVMELSADAARVSQRMTYRVLYEPASRLQLDVPKALFELLSNPRFRTLVDVRLDDQSLSPDAYQDLLDSAEDARDRELIPLSVRLGRARLGSINLELRFDWPLRSLRSAEYTAIPLANPRDAQVLANTATLTPVGPLLVEPSDDGTWLRDDDVVSSNSLQAVGMASRGQASMLRVRVAQRHDESGDRAPISATVVDRAWLQTWLSDQQRMDRVVFRLATGAEVVSLRLPTGVLQTITLVDGREVATVQSDTELVVPLPQTDGNEHTLEVSLTFAKRPILGEMDFQAPILVDALGPRQWFWQLLVPSREHLIMADPKLTSANRWVRSHWFWHRAASQLQPRLEFWTGAIQQPAVPDGMNEYLFGSIGRMTHLHVRTCRRHTLVYGASALTLSLGLALMYWPPLRHPAMLLLLAVLLASATLLFADVALLVSQASLLGVLLALLASLTWLILQPFGRGASDARWIGRPAPDSRSGTPSPWSDSATPHSTISATGPSMGAIVPDSKA